MLDALGWAAGAVLAVYLGLFFWAGTEASRAAGRPIWLFGSAQGRDRLAGIGFRVAFALALIGPLVWLALPVLHKADPIWAEERQPLLGLAGVSLAVIGAVLALAAQRAMGASWRVGVKAGATGALVQAGPFRYSRNPTFLGQLVLLCGVALAIPALPTLIAAVLLFCAASAQIRSEEAVLAASNGPQYAAFRAAVPRWLGLPTGFGAVTPWALALAALLALVVDQVTKAVALIQLTYGVAVPVFPGFNLTLGFNTGASFGMLSGVMAGKPLAMVALTGAITLGMAVLALRARHPWEGMGFALVVGGSLGNIVDRLRQGAVTDFLDVYWQDWHWPTFNMADVAISIGAILILMASLPALRKSNDHV